MIPRLIHPVIVVVEQIDPASQTVDAVFRQPIGTPVKITRTLRGQVKTARAQSLQPTAGGNSPVANSDGHVTFAAGDLTRAGVTLNPGDVIVSEGGVAVRHRITRTEPHGTYGGVHHLLLAFFSNEG
jgi:hypothetical protein